MMNILKEIFREDGIDIQKKTLHREAVRGIVLRQSTILMIHSPVNGDYKFSGGGVNVDETHNDALTREIREECGAKLSYIGQEVGCVIEYKVPLENNYDVFKMTSHYYLCDIDGDFHELRMDKYEQDLGFHPVWVDIDTAIQTNTTLIQSADRTKSRWIDRETFMLKYVKNHI